MKSNDIIRFLYLDYISSSDFISKALLSVRNSRDLQTVVGFSIRDMVRSKGYETDLFYKNLADKFLEDLLSEGIYQIRRDQFFGESLTFDVDRYRQYVSNLIANDSSYKQVEAKVAIFGVDGLARAIHVVAVEHKWRASPGTDIDRPENQAPAGGDATSADVIETHYVSEIEKARIVEELGSLKRAIEDGDLPQADKAQALAYTNAALAIAESPKPNWRLVREILYVISAIATTLAFALQIAVMIK